MKKSVLALMMALAMTGMTACGSTASQSSAPAAPAASGSSAAQSAASGASGTEVQPEFVFRYADSLPDTHPNLVAAHKFADLVLEKTDGRIKIEVYPGGQLGDEKSQAEQMQFGAIDFGRTSTGPLAEFVPSLNVIQLPYLYRDSEHMWKVMDGEIGQSFLSQLEQSGFVGLTWFDGGSRCFYNAKREIKTLADLSGLNIRVMESALMMDMASALGANPTPMNSGEVYSALQTGTIDGAENNWPTYVANGHHEVAPYYCLDEHQRMVEPMFASKATMDKLTPEDQQIIKECAQETGEYQRSLWASYVNDSKEKAIAEGAIVTEISAEEKAKFQEACKPLYEKFGGDNQDLVNQIINTK